MHETAIETVWPNVEADRVLFTLMRRTLEVMKTWTMQDEILANVEGFKRTRYHTTTEFSGRNWFYDGK
jgi:hypothetical protein